MVRQIKQQSALRSAMWSVGVGGENQSRASVVPHPPRCDLCINTHTQTHTQEKDTVRPMVSIYTPQLDQLSPHFWPFL